MRFLRRSSSYRRQSDESGGAVVEFALISTLFLLLTGLIVQGALIFGAWLVITNAVREAARAGAPCYERNVPNWECDLDDIEQWVIDAAGPVAGDAANLQVEAAAADGVLTVRAQFSVPRVAPFLELVMPERLTLVAESAMRTENEGSFSVDGS